MFNIFKKLFSPEEITDIDHEARLQLAAAILMLEVSKADNQIDQQEIDAINHILSDKFSLDSNKINFLLDASALESDKAVSLHNFTREICQQCDHPERIAITSYLWDVALADGKLDAYERHFIRKVAALLHLNDTDINQAKAIAMQKKANQPDKY